MLSKFYFIFFSGSRTITVVLASFVCRFGAVLILFSMCHLGALNFLPSPDGPRTLVVVQILYPRAVLAFHRSCDVVCVPLCAFDCGFSSLPFRDDRTIFAVLCRRRL